MLNHSRSQPRCPAQTRPAQTGRLYLPWLPLESWHCLAQWKKSPRRLCNCSLPAATKEEQQSLGREGMAEGHSFKEKSVVLSHCPSSSSTLRLHKASRRPPFPVARGIQRPQPCSPEEWQWLAKRPGLSKRGREGEREERCHCWPVGLGWVSIFGLFYCDKIYAT